MNVDLRRMSLFAAVLVILGGYAFVFRPLEGAVAERYAGLEAARTTLEQRLTLASRIPQLAGEQAMLETQLRGIRVRVRRADLVEHFLRAMSAAVARNRLAVRSVAADLRVTTVANSHAAQSQAFDEVPLEVALRGSYGDVIHAVRELNGGDVAARMTIASLSDAERRPGARPQLNAAFHVLLLREADDSAIHHVQPH